MFKGDNLHIKNPILDTGTQEKQRCEMHVHVHLHLWCLPDAFIQSNLQQGLIIADDLQNLNLIKKGKTKTTKKKPPNK